MAKKATALETVVLNAYRRISAATPAIHKETGRRHGVSAPTSPWVAVHRLACELLLAVDELGGHSRKAAGIPDLGPIRHAISDKELRQIRQKYQRGTSGRTLEEMERIHVAASIARARLPMEANAVREVSWLCAHRHDPWPEFEKAPSQCAVGMWLTLETQSANGLARDFLKIVWNKRLPRGDWAVTQEPVADQLRDQQSDEEAERAAQERLFGPNAEWRNTDHA